MNKISVILTKKAHEILVDHQIGMMKKSTKNVTVTEALNDILENLK